MEETALWSSAITVVGVWAITVMTPGPNFIATVHTAGTRTTRQGLFVVAGIALGTAIWAGASLAGLGLLFQTATWLYTTVKVVGAAYLIFVGLRMILTRASSNKPSTISIRGGDLAAFRLGLLTDLSNPKAAAFFASLFAVAVPPDTPLWFQAVLVISVVLVAGTWYALAALAMGRPRIAEAYRRFQDWITRIAGVCFVAFGLKLAADR